MYTEEEAREIRCCGPEGCGTWRRVSQDGKIYDAPNAKDYPPGTVFSTDSNPVSRFCIASKCMAWEWAPGPGKVVPAEEAGGVPFAYNTQGDKGYCGLAR